MLQDTQILATEVKDELRFGFTTQLFGDGACIEGERAVYQWMRRLCSSYNGGYWQFYCLSNGGYFMMPSGADSLRLVWPLNWSDEVVSPQAAGVVATLFALSEMMERGADDLQIQNFHLLRDFLAEHPEAGAMFRLTN